MSDCVFCDIVAGRSPASFVYRDSATVAFMDIAALNSGQVVVIPRIHAPYLKDLDEETGASLFTATTRVCHALRHSGIPMDAHNLFLADGVEAGQEIFHVHFLVIPRHKNDDMTITGVWTRPGREELDRQAKMIRKALE